MTAQERSANARVHSDPIPGRNLGFYIVTNPADQRWPQLYLRRCGRWTLGIHMPDEMYFWPTQEAADEALAKAKIESKRMLP